MFVAVFPGDKDFSQVCVDYAIAFRDLGVAEEMDSLGMVYMVLPECHIIGVAMQFQDMNIGIGFDFFYDVAGNFFYIIIACCSFFLENLLCYFQNKRGDFRL